ncbi:MAG: hypothetical protein ACRCZM_09040, partial [Bacteroidales bacterium]
MRTLFTIINQRLTSRGTLSKILTLTTFIFCCISSANAEKVETVLWEDNTIHTIDKIEKTIETAIELYHKDLLSIVYNIDVKKGSHYAEIKVYVQSWDINNEYIGETLGFTGTHSNTSNNNIGLISTPQNCNKYKLILKTISSHNNDNQLTNLTIKANTALPENLELDYRGEKSVTVKWDTELPDQRQRFRVALENNEGINLTDVITTDYNATLDLPTMRPQGYYVRVYSLGDGINNANTMGTTQTELLTYSKSLFCLPSNNASVSLWGSGKFIINLLNASGKIVTTQDITIQNSGTTSHFKRDDDPKTATHLDNEYRIQVVAAGITSSLSEDLIRNSENQVYENEGYLAQLVSDIKGEYNDKFELAETFEDGTVRLASTIPTIIYENETVEFNLTPQTKHIDLRTDELATQGGYQAVIRFQTRKSEDKNNPKLQFFVADMNNNILTSVTAPTISVTSNTFVDKVATLTIPSTITVPHKIIIRCSVEKGNPHNTCYVKDLRISRHDNIATNLQLSSCGNCLNVSWDIANVDEAINNCYAVQVLDETGTFFRAQSAETTENNATISLDDDNIKSGIYKLRVITLGENGVGLGISAMRNFTYIKAGDTFDTGSTTNIDYLMLGLEDNGNIGALNKVAQMTTTNTALSVNKVALQLKITSGQYYFVSFPFQPDQVLVNCDEATHRKNILLRSFNSEGYSNNPSSFSTSYPVMGDGTTTMPFNEIDRGNGYLLSVNNSVTGGVKGEVFVTIIGNVSEQDSRYINYNLQELDVQ